MHTYHQIFVRNRNPTGLKLKIEHNLASFSGFGLIKYVTIISSFYYNIQLFLQILSSSNNFVMKVSSSSQAWAIWSFYFTFVWRHFEIFSFCLPLFFVNLYCSHNVFLIVLNKYVKNKKHSQYYSKKEFLSIFIFKPWFQVAVIMLE